MVKKYLKSMLLFICIIIAFYILTLCYPQPFFLHKIIVGNLTVYSDEKLPYPKTSEIMRNALVNIKKSRIYKNSTKHRIFIVNNPILWTYFTNMYYKVGGLNYVCFNHSIFLRKSDIENNRLYGPSGKMSEGDRTLDYYMAHEMTHTLEFEAMPWYRYPLKTNWVLEGYADYVAHGSQTYESYLRHYLEVPENKGAKYYSKTRTMIAYLLDKEHKKETELWQMYEKYDLVYPKAIPVDKPKIK